MNENALINLKNVTKDFRGRLQEIKVLRGITLDVNKGEFVIILGPSGSGKSTILNLILGLEPPSSGEVFLMGEQINEMSPDDIAEIRKQHVGMVHQQANWIRSLTVIENVAFPLTLRSMPKHKILNQAKEKLEMFQMGDWANFMPSELSSGQQQKVGLARALVTNPELIVADEPTGNLDFKSGRKLVELLSGLSKEGKTIIMVTHDLEYIEFADRIIRILDGKIFEEINNQNGKHNIDELKQRIVSQNIEAEKLYDAIETNAPTMLVDKMSPINRVFKRLKNFNLKKALRNFLNIYKVFLELFTVALTLAFVVLSLFYKTIDKFLSFKNLPTIVKNFRYKLSDLYYVTMGFAIRWRGLSVNFADMIDLSVKNLMSKKVRTYVTIGGVALGIGFTVFLVSIGYGLERLVLKNFSELDQLKSIDVYSSVSQNIQINDTTIADIRNLDQVDEIYPIIAIAGKVNLDGSETDIVAYGVERDYLKKSDLNLLSGEYFPNEEIAQGVLRVRGEDDPKLVEDELITEEVIEEDDIDLIENNPEERDVKKVKIPANNQQQAVVNTAFLDLFGLDSNSAVKKNFDITLVVTDELLQKEYDIESYPTTYEISAVVSNFPIPVIYVPVKDVRALEVKNYTQAKIILNSEDDVRSVRQKIEIMGFRTESIQDTVRQIEDTFRNIRVVLTSIGMVALAVASFGMFNTLTVSLLERVREVGLLKVMGMKGAEIKDLFLTESILLGLGGGFLGVFVGIVSGSFVSSVVSSVAISRGYEAIQVSTIPIEALFGILFVATFTGMLTGLYPSKRATSISALDALRYE